MSEEQPRRATRLSRYLRLGEPARKVYVIVLYAFTLAAIAVGYFYLQDKFHTAGVNACKRANRVRVESNRRIPIQLLDAKNLADLTERLLVTHQLAGAAFAAQAAQAKANRPLVKKLFPNANQAEIKRSTDKQLALYYHLKDAYHHAALTDAEIAASEKAVQYSPLKIVDCEKEVP